MDGPAVLPYAMDGDELYAHLLEHHGGLPERVDDDDDWALAHWHRSAPHVDHLHEAARHLRVMPAVNRADFCGRCGDEGRHARWCPGLLEAS